MIVERENKRYFDLTALLKLNDLGLQSFADECELSAGEYFDLLSEFIKLAPNVESALSRFAKSDGDKDAYRYLDNMATLLKDLGSDKFIADIYSILDAYEKGNWRLAAHYAKGIINSFNVFHSKIAEAKKRKKTEAFPDTSLHLKEFIKQLSLGEKKREEEESRKAVILAVDDSSVVLKSVSSVLSNDYKVYTLPKPTKLEELLKQITPDLFLLDYLMPELDGFELVPIIRSFEEHKETPIIFLTSAGTIDTVTAALALGACDFIVKPFNPDILREKIAKWIVRKKTTSLSL